MSRTRKFLLSAIVIASVLAMTSVAIASRGHANDGSAMRSAASTNTVITGTCKAPKVNFATNDAGSSTTSSAFATIPGMSVTFTIPGSATSCIVAEYSGQAFAPSGALINIQAVLDGASVAAPGEVQLAGDTDENANSEWSRSYAMQFAWPSVAPGTHTVTIQWRSFFSSSVFINKGTMVVQHK
jgi:uncharacterized phage protein gp47/JayE